MQSFEDGVNADRQASDYKMSKTQVNKSTRLKVKLAPGGSWAAHLIP
jgi:alpha-glucosidase